MAVAVAGFEPSTPIPQRPAWDVAALLLAAGDALSARFGAVTVRGELSGFARASSGHCYFSLKDSGGAAALVRCAMFRRAAALVDFDPRDGMQVELRGRIGLYEPRGELQLVVEALRRLGAGTLYEEFLRLRARLEQQGLFEAARKRPPPSHPRRVAVITSPGAAAWHDVMTTLQRRAPYVEVVLVPSLVQGAEAPPALCAALLRAGALAGVDTVLLVRGGGSLEDLWAFNDERVVRAIVACPRPVICGVGHESDVTLSDLAADLRAPTPTAAAELVAPSQAEGLRALVVREASLQRGMQRQLERHAQRLDAAALRLGPAAAAVSAQQEKLRGLGQRLGQALRGQGPRRLHELTQYAQRLQRSVRAPLALAESQLSLKAGRLHALDPHAVLARGYVWVEDAAARPVTSVRGLQPDALVRARWSDGVARARIESVDPAEAAWSPPVEGGSAE